MFILALYDVIFTRRPGGDPTHTLPPPGVDAVTYGNPGYRERGGTNNNGMCLSCDIIILSTQYSKSLHVLFCCSYSVLASYKNL